ncbi:MAG: hypothetical protein AAB483_03335 [Patescibacteria group bacterium]
MSQNLLHPNKKCPQFVYSESEDQAKQEKLERAFDLLFEELLKMEVDNSFDS